MCRRKRKRKRRKRRLLTSNNKSVEESNKTTPPRASGRAGRPATLAYAVCLRHEVESSVDSFWMY